MRRLLRHDLHTLTGAYALDAVEGTERGQFEHHLRHCKPCDHEVRGLAETATGLGMAVAMEPPPDLKQRVLTAAALTRQVPPLPRPRRSRHMPGTRGVPASRPVPRSGRAPRALPRPRLAAAVAAVSLAAAVALGAVGLSTRHQLDQAQAKNRAIAAVLAAPDARIMTQATAAGGTATVVMSRAEQKIIFTTSGLPALPGGKVYELWLMGPPQIREAGLLPASGAGQTAPVLASGLVTGDKIGVTVEPAGGASHPTTAPILLMSLSS